MKRYCSRCGTFHDVNYKHPEPKRKRKKKHTEQSKFRSTNAWKEKSVDIRERDKFLCQLCLMNNVITTKGLSVHHIDSVSEAWDSRLDDENLITLCNEHHKMAEDGLVSKELLKEIVLSKYE